MSSPSSIENPTGRNENSNGTTIKNVRESIIGIPGFLSNMIDSALIPDHETVIQNTSLEKEKGSGGQSSQEGVGKSFFDIQSFNPLGPLGSASESTIKHSQDLGPSTVQCKRVGENNNTRKNSPNYRSYNSDNDKGEIDESGAMLNLLWESDPGQIARCVFCLGQLCRSCSKEAVQNCTNPAIPAMNSNWVTDSIVAMQRPHKKSHFEHPETPLMDSFKKLGITAIINCTEIGEHPYCGDRILESTGLSYDPEEVMAAGVEYYHYGWEDMTVPSVDVMLDIARVGNSVIERGGKVAVHCHAGFGRTGIVIACMIITRENVTAQEAIARVRAQRGKCIQTKLQENFVNQYYQRFKTMNIIFRSPQDQITLSETLSGQSYYLNEPESKFLRNIPKVVYLTVYSLLEKLKNGTTKDVLNVAHSLLGTSTTVSNPETTGSTKWSLQHEYIVTKLIESANDGTWKGWPKIKEANLKTSATAQDLLSSRNVFGNEDNILAQDPRFASILLYDFLSQLKDPILPYNVIVHDLQEHFKPEVEQQQQRDQQRESISPRSPEGPGGGDNQEVKYEMNSELYEVFSDPKNSGTLSLLYKLLDALVHHHAVDANIINDIYERIGIILTNLNHSSVADGIIWKGRSFFLSDSNPEAEFLKKITSIWSPKELSTIDNLEKVIKECSRFVRLTSSMKYPVVLDSPGRINKTSAIFSPTPTSSRPSLTTTSTATSSPMSIKDNSNTKMNEKQGGVVGAL